MQKGRGPGKDRSERFFLVERGLIPSPRSLVVVQGERSRLSERCCKRSAAHGRAAFGTGQLWEEQPGRAGGEDVAG